MNCVEGKRKCTKSFLDANRNGLFLVLDGGGLKIGDNVCLSRLGELNLVLHIATLTDASGCLTVTVGMGGTWDGSVCTRLLGLEALDLLLRLGNVLLKGSANIFS
jgi:hypothetical protein